MSSPRPLKILQASAGSGKTFSLTAHYLTLVLSGQHKYREILAVTFTNKATGEMKSRIMEVLLGFARGDEKYDSYRELVLKANPELNPVTLRERADQVYRSILHDYSRFSVSTIDGFVQKVIRGFAFELGLDAGYSLEMNYDKVKEELVAKLDEALDHNKTLLQWIIDLAMERISDNKSWNYRLELYNLIGEIFKERFRAFEEAIAAFQPEDIEALFRRYIAVNREAIKNFEAELTGLAIRAQDIFNRFGVEKEQLARKSQNPLAKIPLIVGGDFSKIEGLFGCIDHPEGWFQKNVQLDDFFRELNPVLKEIRLYYEQHLPQYTLAIAFNKNLYYLRLMQEIADLLKVYREENDNLLISDAQKLISGITDDAGDNPSFIWEKVGMRYRNFLFDEFQDTSVSQWNSFRSLLSNAMATPTETYIDHLIVGDTKQSIYRWRNGDWNILHRQARMDVGSELVLEESLEENYRSTENIISFNNHLYAAVPKVLQATLNEGLEKGPAALAAWWQEMAFDRIIMDIYRNAAQQLARSTPKGGSIKICRTAKEDTPPLEQVVAEILVLLNERGYEPKDIAVLVRSNSEAVAVVKRLMVAELEVISGEALMIGGNLGVQLIIDTLRVLVGLDSQTALYKANCIALYHMLNDGEPVASHYMGLNNMSLSMLGHVLPESLCANWQGWMQLPLPELVEMLIESYGLDTRTAHLPYLLAFRDLAANATRLGEKGIVAFLTWWDEEGIKKSLPSPEEANAIQVITIHKSKGLAFRAVFVPFCNWEIRGKANSIFWVSSADTAYHELKGIPLRYNEALSGSAVAKAYYEELLYNHMDALNMLYVATTRAKDYLYLGTAAKRDSLKMSNIGDVLNFIFAEQFDEDGCYALEEYVARPEDHRPEGNRIALLRYPTTGRLAELYVPDQDKHLNHVLNMERSGRRGSLLHDILAHASDEAAVGRYLDSLLTEGLMKAEEQEELLRAALDVLRHPELQPLWERAQESITEKTIVDASGRSHRPDRVLLSGDEVIILDYKFTLEETSGHVEQVLNYKDLFRQMGYTKVSGYLFYALSGQLKPV
ncbi:UvrD-helicase domain-containing protein [Pedobacter sp. JY14-1]|uniref:UvrD-helicase domain-containing protein n=1 Tax=Pedobacter sp. JY14-1 TaxID=3034151 RepID=UPI0023E124B0|nr:UvrD-helicase domain-containing protein [Pedobacter sp. JY14-1]